MPEGGGAMSSGRKLTLREWAHEINGVLRENNEDCFPYYLDKIYGGEIFLIAKTCIMKDDDYYKCLI